MYLDDKASPELGRTMLQHSFQYAHVKAFQHMRHLKEDFIVLAQHLNEKMARLIKLFNSQRAAFKLFLRLITGLLVFR
jgi:hypothetical protein